MRTVRNRRGSSWKTRAWILGAAVTLGFLLFSGSVRGQSREEEGVRQAKNESCQEEKVPLRVRGAIALAQILVNGKPMTFIVDSAGMSMINADRVTLRVVKQLRTGPVTVSAAEALESWNVVEVASLRLGNEELRDVRILSRGLPQLEKQLGSEVDGILGADLLTRWDAVSLNYKHGSMMLGRANCGDTHEEAVQPLPKTFEFTRRQ